MKIAVLSDPHIGSEKPVFVPNWEAVVAHANAAHPDLVVILGDLSLDGALQEEDCRFASKAIRALEAPLKVLPGNHDVGDIARDTAQPADEDRLDRWHRHFGPSFWVSDDFDGWRLIGINSQVLDTGLAAEAAQWEALEIALAQSGNRRVILFTHVPLFLESWDEADRPAWAIMGPARQRLRKLIAAHGIRAVISAHMHRVADIRADGEAAFVWTAASSFLSHDASMPPQPGKELLGYTILNLSETDIGVEFIEVEGLMKSYIEDYNGAIYKSPSKDQ